MLVNKQRRQHHPEELLFESGLKHPHLCGISGVFSSLRFIHHGEKTRLEEHLCMHCSLIHSDRQSVPLQQHVWTTRAPPGRQLKGALSNPASCFHVCVAVAPRCSWQRSEEHKKWHAHRPSLKNSRLRYDVSREVKRSWNTEEETHRGIKWCLTLTPFPRTAAV